MKTHFFRLHPHQDIKKEILDFVFKNKIKAGVIVSAVGSLENLNIRLANSSTVLQKKEKFEVLSLNGTLSLEGVHLHISVANSTGQCFGGHLLDENFIFTTLEVSILEFKDVEFLRQHDPQTGYKELIIK